MSRDSSEAESVSSGGAAHTASEKYRPMAADGGGLCAMTARDAPNATLRAFFCAGRRHARARADRGFEEVPTKITSDSSTFTSA